MEAEQVAKTKADFLSIMSHEIRPPLNALIGTTYHMLEARPRKDQKEDLKNMKNASENLLNLINNILDFNKIEQNKLELELSNVKLKSYLDGQVKVFKSNAEKKGIYLDFNYDSRLPRIVRMDKGRVGQILNNLISNAIKFTKEGGVTLNVSEDVPTNDLVNVKFEVIDTGIGINESEKEKVFASFEQANAKISGKYGGTGLGLAISKKLVQHMRSDIALDSSPGIGSKFYFSLELEPIALETETTEVKEELNLSNTYLLLVEDNAMNVMIAKRFLNKWLVKVDVAENGEIAVKMASEHQYDMILMDLQMPVMNGYEAAKVIRRNDYKNPILAMTASAITERELIENGSLMNDYITKPYKPEDLYLKIKSNLDSKSSIKTISPL
jgi:CheY-like chemotaxis protein